MNILLVDDSRTVRFQMEKQLEKMGHHVIAVSNGQTALHFFAHYRPDLVLLDVEMQDLDGYAVAREIRSYCKDHWLPIIFISGLMSDHHIVKGLEAGGDDYLPKPCSDMILQAKIMAMQRLVDMRQELVEMSDVLKSEVMIRKRAEHQLRHLALHDELTGLPNRRMYDDFSDRILRRAKRRHQKVSFLALDLDDFKQVNDSLGHDQGDALLIEVGERFQRCLREEDFVARTGGDEFMMMLEYSGERTEVDMVCQRILQAIQQPFQLAQQEVHIGVSIGASFYPEHGDDRHRLQKKADVALYHSKKSGRNCLRDYTQAMGQQQKSKSRGFLKLLQHKKIASIQTLEKEVA